ncbi:RNA polymerase sigma factor [Paraliomyxa miuraensis]|uniref:RNA polymerase sigma factor n=1 Tax=Paraliomyxa miuraensis TaxID=376150 RepID=UPI00224E77D3|nr:RNA polymerase sigma factor [Paraliomyxa miuraensis]MCX4243129.1 RNA polymerase sigma factor [Paraliomyxa miuraensis]
MASSLQTPGDAPGPSDADLMLAFRGGDARAFEQLISRHQRGIYNFILRSVRDRSRAEELLQEVFLRVVRAKDRYERTAKFTTWIYAIARNLCVDESRRARFRDHKSLDAKRPGRDGEEGGNLLSRLPSPDVPTDEAAEAPTLRKRMTAAIDALPDEQREVFLLRQVSGLSFREIGETLGVPENTVKSRMRYALEKLREHLHDLHGDAPASTAPARAQASTPAAGSRGKEEAHV